MSSIFLISGYCIFFIAALLQGLSGFGFSIIAVPLITLVLSPKISIPILEDEYSKMYLSEEKMGQLFIFFSLLIIFVACLGIFGLASFLAEQRTKEIGVRKVLGATNSQIIILLTKDFIKWVLISNIIAVSYFIMMNWLENFAFKTDMNAWIFLFAGGITLVIAFITISFQSYRSALQDPTETLKYE